MHHAQVVIYSLRRGLGFLMELMPDVVEQGAIIDFRQELWPPFAPPAGEVQQVISVSAQGTAWRRDTASSSRGGWSATCARCLRFSRRRCRWHALSEHAVCSG